MLADIQAYLLQQAEIYDAEARGPAGRRGEPQGHAEAYRCAAEVAGEHDDQEVFLRCCERMAEEARKDSGCALADYKLREHERLDGQHRAYRDIVLHYRGEGALRRMGART